jgi:hypothetical protein
MPVSAQFEQIFRNWVGKTNVHARKISHSYGSCGGTNKNMCKIMENVESRNIKSKFHCIMQHGAKQKTFFLHWSINTEYICTSFNIDFKFQNVICVTKGM